jgi:hypothetical protein
MGEGPLCKIEGGETNPPFSALNLRKQLFYGSITCPVSQGYHDIWIRVCFETIVTFFNGCSFENLPDK